MCVFVHYRAGQQLPNAVSKGHSQRARIHNCRQPQQGILGRKTKTDAPMTVWLFFYDRKVQLEKPEALAINLFSLWAQGLYRNSSSSDIYLGRLQRTETIFKLCHTQYILSKLHQLETQVWYLGMNWARMSPGSGFCSTRRSLLLFHFGKQSTWQFICTLW